MKLSLCTFLCAVACSCGLILNSTASAETPQSTARPPAYDYDAPGPTSLQSDLDAALSSMAAPVETKGIVCGSDMAATDCVDGCDARWTFRVGSIIMKRSNPAALPILSDFGGATMVNAANYNFPYRAGLDIGAIRNLNDCWAVDFRYFGIDSLGASQSNTLAAATVLNNAAPVGFFGFTTADSTYGSNLYSTEFNLRRKHDWLTTFVGYRYVELNEDLNFLLGPLPAVYRESADNRMQGIQIGADATIWNNGARLRLDGWVKAGIYYDLIRHRSAIELPPGTPVFTPVNQRDNNTAFLGEIGLVGVYQLTDTLALRAGYQLLWLDGVALASDQVGTTNFVTGTGADIHGDVFFHGALLGVEATW
ncbi:MAG: hypothetical protein K8R36_13140 [Planctomycetales bacterium]|nr:hypothetical protein [Planctomycetales bacterium]